MNELPKSKPPIALMTPEQAKRLAALPAPDRERIVNATAAILAKAFYRKMNSSGKQKPK